MDVGLFVTLNGVLASFFALLAAIALAVELGPRPVLPPGARKNEPQAGARQEAGKEKIGKENTGTVVTNVESVDLGAVKDSVLSVVEMQRKFVDGLLGPRTKYDVALAILNEIKTEIPDAQEGAVTMAKQAYLSATSTNLKSAVLIDTFGFTREEQSKSKKPKTAKKSKTADLKKPKTSERNKPKTMEAGKPKTSEANKPKTNEVDKTGTSDLNQPKSPEASKPQPYNPFDDDELWE